MVPTQAARNYARAFIEAARGKEDLSRLAAGLHEFAHLVETHSALAAALRNPAIPAAKKLDVAEAVLTTAASSPIVKLAVKMVIANGHVEWLGDIDRALGRAVDREAGIVRAEIRVAQPAGEDQVRDIVAALSRAVGRKVEATVTVDPTLVGGFVARAGDLVFDGSIARQMERLRAQLLGGP